MTTKDLGMVTAYAYAVMGGYEGTEAEFEALLGNIATDLEEIENLTVIANTLPEGSSATASYADGVLTLGIPKGDTGATGAGATVTAGTTTTGNPGTNASVTNSGTTKDAVFNFTIPRGDTGNGIESIYLTGTSGAVKTYTILFTDGNTTTFDVTDGEVTNASLAEVLEDYAKTDGAYESMTVGNAEQLISSVTVNDKVPYNFRTSGGSIDIGDREFDTLVGGSVAWNQLAPELAYDNGWRVNANFGTAVWGTNKITYTITVKGGSQSINRSNANGGIPLIKNHKYIVSMDALISTGSSDFRIQTMDIQWTIFPTLQANVKTHLGKVFESTKETGVNAYFGIFPHASSGLDVGAVVEISNLNVIDLTQLFGSTIADYIYSLEQATAGAGVAWFKKLFPKDYYPYNAGELMSVKTSAHQMVGFNAWDEEWELGTISAQNGQTGTDNTRIRSKNYNPCVPNTTYYVKDPTNNNNVSFRFYDADKNYLGYGSGWIGNTTFVTPANCAYFKFVMGSAYGTTYKNDICINLSWDGERDGDYEAYKKWTYPLDSDLELRGIPKLDSANNLYYDGDTYEDDGTVTRKYGIVDLGTLNWIYDGDEIFRVPDARMKFMGNGICTKYKLVQVSSWSQIGDGEVSVTNSEQSPILRVHDSTAGTDATAFKTAMSGVYLVYELATPTTETADPYQNPQIVDDFGTEEYVDERTVAIPVGHDTEYMNNLKAKLEMAPDSPDGDGDYVLRQTNGENSYVPLMKELPSLPSTDGTYTLKCTVASGVATLGWEREE